MGSKTCKVCGELKPLTEFYAMAAMRDGYRNDCKDCNRAAKRARYAADPAKYIAMVQRWQRENVERQAGYQAEYRQRPERKRAMRDLYYRRTYGMSADQADELLAAQGGGCAICGARPERLASLHLDHDHVTGAVRGFLCIDCNHGLGKFKDDPALLAAAIEYLARHSNVG